MGTELWVQFFLKQIKCVLRVTVSMPISSCDETLSLLFIWQIKGEWEMKSLVCLITLLFDLILLLMSGSLQKHCVASGDSDIQPCKLWKPHSIIITAIISTLHHGIFSGCCQHHVSVQKGKSSVKDCCQHAPNRKPSFSCFYPVLQHATVWRYNKIWHGVLVGVILISWVPY